MYSRQRRRLAQLAAISVVAVGGSLSAAGLASAATYNPCSKGSGSGWTVCKSYGFFGNWTMRWGSSTWGYIHIRDNHGFTQQFDQQIEDTIDFGKITVEGTTRVVNWGPDYNCKHFRVVYQTTSDQGIITAYCVG
jgi:hypothetical protein